jgi:hypothetical protein
MVRSTDPALRQDEEFARLESLDDLELDLAASTLQSLLEFRPLIAAVEGEQPEQEPIRSTLPSRSYISGVDDGVQQQPLGIYEKGIHPVSTAGSLIRCSLALVGLCLLIALPR